MSDPGILCFQHCGPKIFCHMLPNCCPACLKNLATAKFELLPFRLPYPFVKPYQHPCSIILRPTIGDFMNDYFNSTDLHIAVTTSTGVIVEFDRCGLRKTSKNECTKLWPQSLLVETIPEAWMEHWDDVLLETCTHNEWTSSAYEEDLHNCYTFVLTFLRALNYGALSKTAFNRTLFCEKYIVPRTTAAGKYISLYRKIRDNGHYIHPVDSGSSSSGGGGSAAADNIVTASLDEADGSLGGKGDAVLGKLFSIKE